MSGDTYKRCPITTQNLPSESFYGLCPKCIEWESEKTSDNLAAVEARRQAAQVQLKTSREEEVKQSAAKLQKDLDGLHSRFIDERQKSVQSRRKERGLKASGSHKKNESKSLSSGPGEASGHTDTGEGQAPAKLESSDRDKKLKRSRSSDKEHKERGRCTVQ